MEDEIEPLSDDEISEAVRDFLSQRRPAKRDQVRIDWMTWGLYTRSGWSVQQIALELDMPLHVIEARLMRASERVGKLLPVREVQHQTDVFSERMTQRLQQINTALSNPHLDPRIVATLSREYRETATAILKAHGGMTANKHITVSRDPMEVLRETLIAASKSPPMILEDHGDNSEFETVTSPEGHYLPILEGELSDPS